MSSPKIPGTEPVFRHLDDPEVPWQAVKAQRNADGSDSFVHEKWLAFSPDPAYLSLYAHYDPGMVVRRHGHYSPHVVFVIAGDLWCGPRHCPAGTHIELPLGAAFGPLVAGADGATLFEVMLGDPRSWGDDPDAFEQALDAVGARGLPDPPLTFPAWLEDLRSHWADDEEMTSARSRPGPDGEGGVTHHPPFLHTDAGSMGCMAEDDFRRDDGCSRCGRRSDSVTVEELGRWIVEVDSALICAECSTEGKEGDGGQRVTA